VAEELGDLPAFWCTINEPNIYAYQGWMAGEFPPGRRGDLPGFYQVLANLRRAHEAAYRELVRLTPGVPVGLAQHKWLMLPAEPRRRLDRLAAAGAQVAMDRWPVGHGRLARVVEAPSDYLGLNHYTGSLVAFDALRPGEAFGRRFKPARAAGERLRVGGGAALAAPVPGGAAATRQAGLRDRERHHTNDDARRAAFLQAVLGQVWEAIRAGVDVRGYFHWTSMDNFEWARGYSMRFGLVSVDRETQERTVKPSGQLFARIAEANALPTDP